MIFNPVMVKTDGKEIKELRVKRSGYESDWTITVGGTTYTLERDEETLPYTEGQEIGVPSNVKSTKVAVGGGQVILTLDGGAGGGSTVPGPEPP